MKMFSKKEIAKIKSQMQGMTRKEQIAFAKLKQAENEFTKAKKELAQAKKNFRNAKQNAKTERQCEELDEIIKSLR